MIRALILALLLALPAAPALSQSGAASTTMQVYITRTGDGPASEVLDLPLSKAAIIHLPIDAADVLVTNPEVADAVIRCLKRPRPEVWTSRIVRFATIIRNLFPKFFDRRTRNMQD